MRLLPMKTGLFFLQQINDYDKEFYDFWQFMPKTAVGAA